MCITNALLVCAWVTGVGAVRVEYPLREENYGERGGYSFREDARIGVRVLEGYKGSGYDRGHLAAAADFGNEARTLAATYKASNLAPMVPEFNRGRWAQVEAAAREVGARCGGEGRCVVVPIYGRRAERGCQDGGGGDTRQREGKTLSVRVPSAFLKVVYSNDVAVAAWLEEQK